MKWYPRLSVLAVMTIFLFLSVRIPPSIGADKLVLATGAVPDTEDFKFVELLYGELSKRTGIEIVVEYYPVKRCAYFANEGVIDGVVERSYDYQEDYPNLIRVESNLRKEIWIALSADPDIRMHGWEGLKDTDYKVDFVLGTMRPQKELTQYVSPENLTAVVANEQGIKKLAAGRTQVFVVHEGVLDRVLRRDEMKQYTIYKAGVMEETPSHMFVHKKYKDIVPRISAALKQMKEEGLVGKYEAIALGMEQR